MEYFRHITKRTLLRWSLLLSIALLCAQTVGLHVHMDYGHDGLHAHAAHEMQDHTHLNTIHFAYDIAHDIHPDNSVATEIELYPEGLLKNSNTVFAIALVIFFVTLVIASVLRVWNFCGRDSKLVLHKHYTLSPPLRAPPLQ